jgi:F0F1-type ATP synthase membrane subunit b/b'
MKITISVDDKEVLSFDVIVLLTVLLSYLFYKTITTYYSNTNDEVRNSIVQIEEEPEVESRNYKKEEEKKGVESEGVTTPIKSEEEKKKQEFKAESQSAQKQPVPQKFEEAWTVVRNGKKIKLPKKN